jgi:glycosyltransferase involved in cell wall biosynthesis
VIEILARSGFKGTIRVAGTGPLLNRLRSIRLPDELKVDFLGWCNTNQVEEIINQSDALIFPSECDEWGLAVVEAINLGRPVLGSIRAGAVEELLVNHRHGYLFDPFDPEAIKGAFDKFSELSDEEISELSSNCLKLSAERKLSAKNMAMLFDEIIRKSLN